MDRIVIEGGVPLRGEAKISGSKNSVLPILAATLLTEDPCVIRRVPDLSDVRFMLQLLQHLGAEVERLDPHTVRVRARSVADTAPYDLVRKMRASVCLLGPLVGRLRRCRVSVPGGCVIGPRPIDLHLKGLNALGAHLEIKEGYVVAESRGLEGASVSMSGRHGSTVLGTDNVMMAATLARGRTVIEHAAGEPEVADLAAFLNAMGARVSGAGASTIVVDGSERLHGAEFEVVADRIEAATFLAAGAITGGEVAVHPVVPAHLLPVIALLRDSGFDLTEERDRVALRPRGPIAARDFATGPFPAFPTDAQAQMMALMCVTPGTSVITERVFPDRFMHVAELQRMGARIEMESTTAVVQGVEHLSGAPVMASDLRASAALVLAGLVARGATEIRRVYHIDRGYEQIDEKLRGLGARIQRIRED